MLHPFAFTEIDLLGVILLVGYIVLGFIAAVAVSANRRPAAAIAWILTIVFIPVIGVIAFLLIGIGRLPRARRDKQREVNVLMLERSGVRQHAPGSLDEPGWLASAVHLNEQLGALPMVADNTATLLDDYEATFDAMIADIDAAKQFVHVEFYILVKDAATTPFFDALARATARGVAVRVLSDHVSGFLFPHRRETERAFADMGARWRPMLPLRPLRGQWQRPDMRNHRKLVVVDGVIGYTGSQNLIASSYLKKGNIKRGLHDPDLVEPRTRVFLEA